MATVLVVDDEAAIRELVALILESDGHVVWQARNGREALDLLAQQLPQLVLTDSLMPVVGGIELVHAIKSRADLATIPVILMTADGRERAVAAGADAVLTKPFDLDVLEAVIQHWLR